MVEITEFHARPPLSHPDHPTTQDPSIAKSGQTTSESGVREVARTNTGGGSVETRERWHEGVPKSKLRDGGVPASTWTDVLTLNERLQKGCGADGCVFIAWEISWELREFAEDAGRGIHFLHVQKV